MNGLTAGEPRIPWVDIVKGVCIVSVVAMWVDRYLELDGGWLHAYAVFAKPFRMPDFFLISGLFLDKVIDQPWRVYLDRKVLHYLYFVLLWAALTLLASDWIFHWPASPATVLRQYILYIVQPPGPLWFITMLPVYFVVTRLLRGLPVALLLGVAALLYLLPWHTGLHLPDAFGNYYLFFLIGYFGASRLEV